MYSCVKRKLHKVNLILILNIYINYPNLQKQTPKSTSIVEFLCVPVNYKNSSFNSCLCEAETSTASHHGECVVYKVECSRIALVLYIPDIAGSLISVWSHRIPCILMDIFRNMNFLVAYVTVFVIYLSGLRAQGISEKIPLGKLFLYILPHYQHILFMFTFICGFAVASLYTFD